MSITDTGGTRSQIVKITFRDVRERAEPTPRRPRFHSAKTVEVDDPRSRSSDGRSTLVVDNPLLHANWPAVLANENELSRLPEGTAPGLTKTPLPGVTRSEDRVTVRMGHPRRLRPRQRRGQPTPLPIASAPPVPIASAPPVPIASAPPVPIASARRVRTASPPPVPIASARRVRTASPSPAPTPRRAHRYEPTEPVTTLPSPVWTSGPRAGFPLRLSGLLNFADRLGGAVVEAIVGAYRWLEATRLGRALRVTTCAMCGARRRRYNYSMELPNASPDDVAGRLAARDWGAFRYLGRAPTGRMQLLLSFLGCPSCGRDVTLEVLWIQGSWKRVLVKGLDLSEAEVQFLFTIPAVSSYSIERT